MAGFSFVATLSGTAANTVATLSDLDIGWGQDGPVLFATSRTGNNITIFDLDTAPRQTGQYSLPGSISALGDLHLDLVEIGGRLHAVALTAATRGLPSYAVNTAAGLLTSLDYLSADGLGQQVTAMNAAQLGGQQYLWVAAEDQVGISCFRVGAGDVLYRHPDGAAGAGAGTPGGISAMANLTIGTQPYLFTTSASDDRVFSYQMRANGTLKLASSLGAAEGLGLNAPTALEQVTLNGQNFLLVAASGSSSISVLQIGTDGGMTATDHLVDNRNSRFQNITVLETVEVDGRVYVLAGGADDGLSLFTLLPDGHLLHLESVADQLGFSLQNVSALAATAHNGMIQVFAGSATEAGVTQFTVDPGTIGEHFQARANGVRLEATARDDILQDGRGNDDLRGGAGDDILMGGQGADRFYGGEGRDIFVVAADGTGDQIRDFQSGLDRIDLSGWPMLRGIDQVQITSVNNGGAIQYRDENLRIYTPDGHALTSVEIAAAIMDNFLHFSVEFLTAPMTLTGTRQDDILRGRSGDDLFLGRAGADQMIGGDGSDTASYDDSRGPLTVDLMGINRNTGIAAGDRFDSIENLLGSRDRDRLFGNEVANTLNGINHQDTLYGRGGNDILIGGGGNDTLVGGAGADELRGGAHYDRVAYFDSPTGLLADLQNPERNTGEAAGDTYFVIEELAGSNFDDLLYGGSRGNRLSGLDGADQLFGRSGDDLLLGGRGRDYLHGGEGDDLLRGGRGPDTFLFIAGDDRIEDFDRRAHDRIELRARDLWEGTLSTAQVVQNFGHIDHGMVVLDFGHNNSLTIEDLSSLNGLMNDLFIV